MLLSCAPCPQGASALSDAQNGYLSDHSRVSVPGNVDGAAAPKVSEATPTTCFEEPELLGNVYTSDGISISDID